MSPKHRLPKDQERTLPVGHVHRRRLLPGILLMTTDTEKAARALEMIRKNVGDHKKRLYVLPPSDAETDGEDLKF